MKISISGLTGVGKTTTAEHISKILGIPQIAFSMKDEAKARGMTIVELQNIAAVDKNLDLDFDKRQIEEMKKHPDFVTSTWLGPWFANADINVWLYASDEIRAQRVAKRDGLDYENAVNMMRMKDAQNKERYLKLYNINIADVNKFHVCVNTGILPPEQVARVVLESYKIMMTK
jgi:cytidylate kinase